ncbi:hypothetical protein B0J18DRAFT_116770 [Chaetomium sp. MPI-SDFR-AT-0129]|nr:hypothetical protein B0J18DRAFT_116770 [Chaetomium sp. MPI-SDFR-AT-0129]
MEQADRCLAGSGGGHRLYDKLVRGPKLIETEEGYIGRGPRNAEPGDHIFLVRHCENLLVFRYSDSARGCVTLLGRSDIFGLDNGGADGNAEYEKLWIA